MRLAEKEEKVQKRLWDFQFPLIMVMDVVIKWLIAVQKQQKRTTKQQKQKQKTKNKKQKTKNKETKSLQFQSSLS